jgi:hypothetical protein
MKRAFNKFREWCNLNIGVIAFGGFLVAIYALFPDKGAPIHAGWFAIQKIINILASRLELPIYLLVGLVIMVIFLLYRNYKRYKSKQITKGFLRGKWKNEWGPPNNGYEILIITDDLKYYVPSLSPDPIFDLKDFAYDTSKNQISFRKVGIRLEDNRDVQNVLRIVNNDFLEGIEANVPIKYSRISSDARI